MRETEELQHWQHSVVTGDYNLHFCQIASGMYLNVPFRHRHRVREHGEIIAARIMHYGGNLAGIRKMHHLSDGGLGALFVLFSSLRSCALSKAENG